MTLHIKEMIRERVSCLPLPENYLGKLYGHIHKIKDIYRGRHRVLIDRLDDDIVKQDPLPHRRHKNELWVVLEYGVPVTLYRRQEGLPFRHHLREYTNLEYKLN